MNPKQAFHVVNTVLASQRLSLTPPEFAQLLEAMKTLEVHVNPPPTHECQRQEPVPLSAN